MNKRQKNNKNENIIARIQEEQDSTRKTILLKKRNRSLKSKIKFINIFYYIITVAISFPVQVFIMNTITEISNIDNYFLILISCMLLYYILSIIMYSTLVYPHITDMIKEFKNNIYEIYQIRENYILKNNKIRSQIQFNNIYKNNMEGNY